VGRDDVGSNGVKVDIAYKGNEIVVLITENGFVSVFKQVPGAAMFSVKVLRVPREELSHGRGYAIFSTLEKDVDMVAHENPGIDRAFTFLDVLAQPFKKAGPVFIIPENIRLVDPPAP